MLILDRGLGTQISSYDTRDFAFPVANTMNDRLYLVANNGLIVCLHDKEYVKPFFHQRQTGAGTGGYYEDRVKLAKDNLTRKISHPGYPDPMPFRNALEKIRRLYSIQIFCSDRTFTTATPPLSPVNDKLVSVPKVDKVPLGEFIKKVLAQAGATYELTADVLQVVPLRAKPPAEKDKDKGPAPEPAPDKKPMLPG